MYVCANETQVVNTHTHTHTHIYIHTYINLYVCITYMYICMHVFIYVCIYHVFVETSNACTGCISTPACSRARCPRLKTPRAGESRHLATQNVTAKKMMPPNHHFHASTVASTCAIIYKKNY